MKIKICFNLNENLLILILFKKVIRQNNKPNRQIEASKKLNCKEIQPVHPEGDKSWVFTGRTDAEAETPILWPPHAELTHWKRP